MHRATLSGFPKSRASQYTSDIYFGNFIFLISDII